MSLSVGIVATREVGQLPLSIPTSLAFESLLDIHPDLPWPRPPLQQYDSIWVNLRTLYRNFIGSFDQTDQVKLVPAVIFPALYEEWTTIVDILSRQKKIIKPFLYFSNYNGIDSQYPHATVRTANTQNQKDELIRHNATMELFLKSVPKETTQIFNLKLQSNSPDKAIILTHYAYDLLSHPFFGGLDLLESHTGAIKNRGLWHTKFYQGKELNRIPFREDMLQIFGDNETFRPMDIKFRKAILEIAEKYQWSAVTTRAKILYSIGQLKNPYYQKVLRDILTV